MSSSTQDRIPQLDLGSTFGALFIGVTIAAVLFGVTNVQAFIYFQTHRDTGRTCYKLAVICLWILDALHLALIVHCVYHYLVIDYANIGALMEIVWSFKLQGVIDVLIVSVVYILYFYRIWILSSGRSKALPITVGIIVTLSLGVGIGEVSNGTLDVGSSFKPNGSPFLGHSHLFTDLIRIAWSIYMTFGMTTFVDIVIASSLCYLLATSRTGFSSTDSLITKFLSYIIVYVNSFLALLNARYYVQPNADATNSNASNIRHDVYRSNPHIRTLPDEDLQLSGKSMFKHSDDELRYPTRPVQVVMPQRPIDD
ncbi:hypothetical protein DFH29DRAFT_1005251 [Suillus ampliporus]|nr:hypothetical protein DFH29DRAFT_1005251 [Suillus ampliporus]